MNPQKPPVNPAAQPAAAPPAAAQPAAAKPAAKPPKKHRRSRPVTSTEVFRRTLFLGVVLGILLFAILIAKQFHVQLIDYETYQSKAVSQQTKSEIIDAERGVITDVNGNELAVSITSETVVLVPNQIKDEDGNFDDALAREISSNLSSILGIPYETIYAKASKTDSGYEYVERKIDTETADKVRAFIEDREISNMLYLINESDRYYPYGDLASTIIGFCGMDNNGLYGIELYYDDILQGTPGRIIAARNGKGVDMDASYEQYTEAQDGDTVELTIDNVIQGYLETALEKCRENTGASSVTGVVMDVNTAQVLAAGTAPGYDLNDPYTITDTEFLASLEEMTEEQQTEAKSTYRNELWRNMLVGYTYEPGSVFKIITGSMAIEENLVSEADNFYCGGKIELNDEEVKCWKHAGHGDQTFTQGVMHSCNMCFIELGFRLGAKNFFKYFQAFGLTEKTGITLPGEAGGASSLYHDEQALNVEVQLANSAFGQTFKVTPIQMITAVSAAVNGGTLYKPQIVSRLLSADGTVKTTYEPEFVRQVVSESTSETMSLVLEQVVCGEEGTGRNAYVPGYRVGGKTGTSQKMDKLDENGDPYLYVVSFLGFAPANDPQVAVLVLVDEPTIGNVSGGSMAAPTVGEILQDTLAYLNVEPQYTEAEYAVLDVSMPNFVGMTLEQAQERAAQDGLTITFKGSGDTVTDQLPAAGSTIPRDSNLLLYTEGTAPQVTIHVPDLTGMTLTGIKKLMGSYEGYYLRPVGLVDYGASIQCVSQEPAVGSEVPYGTVITLDFRDTDAIE